MKIFKFGNELSDFIVVNSSSSDQKLIILVDSQADISIIKLSALKKIVKIDNNEVVIMRGITNETISSMGSCFVNISIQNLSIEHKFHVVSDEFPMPAHAIVGKDFLRRHGCYIDYCTMMFTVNPKGAPLGRTQLKSEVMHGISALAPRSESFKLFHLNSKQFPCVIPAQRISANVFIPTTIAFEKQTYIRVLNTNDDMKLIDTQIPRS